MQESRYALHSEDGRPKTPQSWYLAMEVLKLSCLDNAPHPGHSPLQFASAFSFMLTFNLPSIPRRQAEQTWSFPFYR